MAQTLLRFIHRENEHIGLNLFNHFGEVTPVRYLANNFNVRLVGNSGHHEFPHQAGPICNKDADSLHIVLQC